MKHIRTAVIVVILVCLAGAGVWWYFASQGPPVSASEIAASGFIEADEVSVTPEIGGRIVSIGAAEGDPVKAGAVLLKLDESLLQAQARQSQAAVAVAQAGLQQGGGHAAPYVDLTAPPALAGAQHGDAHTDLAQLHGQVAGGHQLGIVVAALQGDDALALPAAGRLKVAVAGKVEEVGMSGTLYQRLRRGLVHRAATLTAEDAESGQGPRIAGSRRYLLRPLLQLSHHLAPMPGI